MIERLPEFQKENAGLFLGLDLGKKQSQLAVLDETGAELANFAFPSVRENFRALAGHLRETDSIALEVSTSANAAMSIFRTGSEARSVLSNPLFTRAISKARVKSDREDARKLADLNRTNYLETVWYPDEDTLRLRHFISDRRSLVKYKTMLKNQVHSVLDRSLIKHSHSDLFGGEGREWLALLIERKDTDCYERDRLRFLVAEIARQELLATDLDKTIAAFISSRPAMRRNLDLLLSIPGVSLAVGATVLAAAGDITRFPTKRKFACYFGLTQRIKQTGGHAPRIGRISKQGNAYARFMLVEAAEHFRKASPVYRRLFERIKKKRGRNVAIVALARRLAEVIWAILTRQEEFVFTSPRLTMEKQARVSKAASDKANLKLARRETNQIIRGTNLRGRDIKEEIYRRASDKAAGILDLMEMGKRLAEASPTGFNPRRPTHADWHKVLELVATEYVRELALAKAA